MYMIYKHTTPNKKIYIGITSQSAKDRWRNGKGYKSQVFYRAIKKYGWDNILHEILFENLTKEEAEAKEILLIKQYKSNDKRYGYNVSNGGNCKGKHSNETKKKIGLRHKGKIVSEETRQKMRENHADFSGVNSPNWGKKFSAERCKQMSESHKGKQAGEKNPMYGKHHSKDTRIVQSEHRKGKCVGKNNPKARSVEKYTMNGEFIKKYDCVADAARELNIKITGGGHIVSCARGKLKSAYGYKWKYSQEEISEDGVV